MDQSHLDTNADFELSPQQMNLDPAFFNSFNSSQISGFLFMTKLEIDFINSTLDSVNVIKIVLVIY